MFYSWRDRLFYLLLAAVLLMSLHLVQKYNVSWDASDSNQNSLHADSKDLLGRLHGPLALTAFIADLPVHRGAISQLVAKYKQVHPETSLEFMDPSAHPEQSRKLGIDHGGQMLVEYNNRTEKIERINEQTLTNAIAKLSLKQRGWLVNLQGHGEKDLFGEANFDLMSFTRLLQERSYKVINMALESTGQLPTNTSLVIVAGPRSTLSSKEQSILLGYLQTGGNLLWLIEAALPPAISNYLEVKTRPGIIVDAAAADLDIDTPTMAVASNHPNHRITQRLAGPVLMPGARALTTIDSETSWSKSVLLATGARSWNETGTLSGEISRDPVQGETSGPHPLALALTRTAEERQQRVVITSDADFLSNLHLGNAENQYFGLAVVHWLTDNEHLVAIPPRQVPDRILRWQGGQLLAMVSLYLLLVPMLLAATGIVVHYRRQRR